MFLKVVVFVVTFCLIFLLSLLDLELPFTFPWNSKKFLLSYHYHYHLTTLFFLFLIQLSRVMPPGYEDLTAPKFKPIVIQQTGGPPQQITRTVNQSPKNIIRTVPGNLPNYPPPPQQPQQIYPPPPAQAPYPPGPVVYAGQPPPPQQVYYDRPPPVASQPYPFPPPQQPIQQPPPVPAPAPHVQYIPSPVAQYPPPPFVSPPPQNLTPPKGGPPYPVEDTVTITRTVGQQVIWDTVNLKGLNWAGLGWAYHRTHNLHLTKTFSNSHLLGIPKIFLCL